MVLARLGRRRVAIVLKESCERPSDNAGLIYMPFKELVDEVKAQSVPGAEGGRLFTENRRALACRMRTRC